MKNGIMLFFVLTLCLNAQDMGMKDIIDSVLEKGNVKKIEKLEQESIKIRKDAVFYRTWADLRLELQPQYFYYTNRTANPAYWDNFDITTEESPVKNYTGTINTNLIYKSFFLHTIFDDVTTITRNRWYGSFEIGINQSLGDLFYNEDKYRENIVAIDEKNSVNNLNSRKVAEIEDVIDQYVRIKNIEIDISLKENTVQENESVLINLRERLKLHEGVELDIDFLELENSGVKEDIDTMKEQLKIEIKNLWTKLGRDVDESVNLKEIEEVELTEIKAKTFELNGKEIEMERENEILKRAAWQNQPTINLNSAYDIEYQRWRINLYVNMFFYNYGGEQRLAENNLKRMMTEKENIKKNIENAKEKRTLEYERLRKSYEMSKKKEEYWGKRDSVNEKMYKKGYIGLVDFIKTRNKYNEMILSCKKAENELKGYKYKNKYYN